MIDVAECTWPIRYAECGEDSEFPLVDSDINISEDTWKMFEEMAVNYLDIWTGNRFGTCKYQIRPCISLQDCAISLDTSVWQAVLSTSPKYRYASVTHSAKTEIAILGRCPSCCLDSCHCYLNDPRVAIRLPKNIVSIEAIYIDGELVDPATYEIRYGSILVRLGGEEWPTVPQDMLMPPTEKNTWMIEATLGTPVPVGGQIAAGSLATEFVKAACKDNSCQLPQRVQTITRQDISMTLLDNFSDIMRGITGVFLVDSWVASVNHRTPRSFIHSPTKPPSYPSTKLVR